MIAFYQHVYPAFDFLSRSERQRERIREALRGSNCPYSIVSSECGTENETLARLHSDAQGGGADYYVYLHLKGLTHPGDARVDDWCELLEYFNIDCWQRMRSELDAGADGMGVNLLTHPFLHYSGNFFWIKRSALWALPPPKPGENPEAWVGRSPDTSRLRSLHDSNVDHYHQRYPAERYRSIERRTLPTDIPTGLTAAEAGKLQDLAGSGRVLELGAQYGFSTIVLAAVAEVVHTVDWHRGDSMAGYVESLQTFFTNLSRYEVANVTAHVGRFEDVLPLFGAATFDGCFIDGAHDLDSVQRDTLLAFQLVKPGGWFAWHDYARPGCDVDRAVDPIAAERGFELERVEHLAWTRLPQ